MVTKPIKVNISALCLLDVVFLSSSTHHPAYLQLHSLVKERRLHCKQYFITLNANVRARWTTRSISRPPWPTKRIVSKPLCNTARICPSDSLRQTHSQHMCNVHNKSSDTLMINRSINQTKNWFTIRSISSQASLPNTQVNHTQWKIKHNKNSY